MQIDVKHFQQEGMESEAADTAAVEFMNDLAQKHYSKEMTLDDIMEIKKNKVAGDEPAGAGAQASENEPQGQQLTAAAEKVLKTAQAKSTLIKPKRMPGKQKRELIKPKRMPGKQECAQIKPKRMPKSKAVAKAKVEPIEQPAAHGETGAEAPPTTRHEPPAVDRTPSPKKRKVEPEPARPIITPPRLGSDDEASA
jgi:hypothetical protein